MGRERKNESDRKSVRRNKAHQAAQLNENKFLLS